MKQKPIVMKRDMFGNAYYDYGKDVPEDIPKFEFNQDSMTEPDQNYILVKSKKEARDYAIVKDFNEKLGKVHFLVLQDDTIPPGQDFIPKKIFTKRINPGSFDMEFEEYCHISVEEADKEEQPDDKSQIRDILDRLDKLEDLATNIPAMLQGLSGKKVKEVKVEVKKEEVVDE